MKILGEPDAEAFFATASSDQCARCGGESFADVWTTQDYVLNDNDTIAVTVPVIECSSCGFSFTDHRAEKIRHASACTHLGLLTPELIKKIRQDLSMSRREFDQAFGIPPATMERWENGRLYQNRSLDTLLRALQNPATAARLDRRRDVTMGAVVFGRFENLERHQALKDAQVRSEDFKLRAAR